MSDLRAVPTLTMDGWVVEPRAKLIKLLQYMIYNESDTSDYFETFNIHGTVRKYVKRPPILAKNLELEIERYLATYFDEVNIRVEAVITDRPEAYDLSMQVSVVQDGIEYSVGRVMQVKDGDVVPDDIV